MKTPNDTNHKHHRAAFWLRAMELRKHELTREYRETLRDKAREGISEEDLRITDETLEKMAKNLGWDESQHDGTGFHGRPFGIPPSRHDARLPPRTAPVARHGHDDHDHERGDAPQA